MTREEFIQKALRVRQIIKAMTNGIGSLELALDEDPSLQYDIDLWRKVYTEAGGFSEGNKVADLTLMEKYLFEEDVSL